MGEGAEMESQGKAWWVQLQHQRAVNAGCHFYTHRPATSGSILSKQQQASCFNQTRRPSTVGSSERSSRDTSDSLAALTHQHTFCVMRPGTSPKLPARRALVSRQTSRSHQSSTAASNMLPASRGNDWSPVHSRPATRGVVSNMHGVQHLAVAQISLTTCCPLALTDHIDAASALVASKHAPPPILKHRKQRLNRSSSISNRPLPMEALSDRPDPQASASGDSAAMPVALTVDTVQTSGMPTTTAPSTTPLKARAPLVINANDRVKVYSMMHPGQRQHKAARLKAAIASRFEAWAPLTEAQFAAQSPGTAEREEAEAAAEAEAVAVKPVQYRAVPAGRGAQRAAIHAIMKPDAVTKQQPDVLISKGSSWDSKRMKSAFIKAVYVARFAEGAATAERRCELKQQQISSSAVPTAAQVCAWPKAAQHRQTSKMYPHMQGAASSSSSCQGLASVAPHLGKLHTSRKLPSSNSPAPALSRLGSHETALADHRPQPLSRRPSTVPGTTASCHALPPKSPCRPRRPATVGTTSQQSHDCTVTDSPQQPKAERPSTESAVALLDAADQDSATPPGSSSRGAKLPKTALDRAESGSLDSALQRRSNPAPDDVWRAAVSAAGVGHLLESEHARFSRLPHPDSNQHSHTRLTPNNMLSFAQGDLTSSNDSSPALSPRPPSRALDFVPSLKARCAVAEMSSPGITPRLVVRSRDLGVARFEAHPSDDADQHVEEVKERAALLAVRIASQASAETENGVGESSSIAKILLQDQSSPLSSSPMWGEHLWREKALYDAVDQSKANALAHNPMCHPLLTAVAGV